MSDDQPLSQEDLDALLAGGLADEVADTQPPDSEPSSEGQDTAPAAEESQPAEVPVAQQDPPSEDPATEEPADVTAEAGAVDAPMEATPDPVTSAAAPAPEPLPAGAPSPQPMALPDFEATAPADEPQPIDMLKDVNLHVKIELGRSRMLVEDVLRLGAGSIVELNKLAGDPVDVYVNERLVARGEVLVLNDNFCVRVNEITTDLSQDFQRI